MSTSIYLGLPRGNSIYDDTAITPKLLIILHIIVAMNPQAPIMNINHKDIFANFIIISNPHK